MIGRIKIFIFYKFLFIKRQYSIIYLLTLFFLIFLLNNNIEAKEKKLFIGTSGKKNFDKLQKIVDSKMDEIISESNEIKVDFLISEFIRIHGTNNIESLSRYRSDNIIPVLLRLIDHPEDYVKEKILFTLKRISNKNVFSNAQMLYTEKSPIIREYLSVLLETSENKDFLKQWLKTETNEYVRFSLEKSIMIKSGPENALNIIDSISNFRTIKRLKYYKFGNSTDLVSPGWNYYQNEIDYPLAEDFMTPIQEYYHELIFDMPRKSFGIGRNRVHTGDDCGWYREGLPVHAVANGIVRIIGHSNDWGTLILIEHKLKKNTYLCSLYGHLSKFVYVKPGSIVKKGERIGLIGTSYSYENGGYGAHLHFGLHEGKWLQPRYIKDRYIIYNYSGVQNIGKIIDVTQERILIKSMNNKVFTMPNDDTGLEHKVLWITGYELKQNGTKGWLSPWDFFKN